MKIIIEDNDEDQFANCQSSRGLRVSSDARELDAQLDPEDLPEYMDSQDRLEALKPDTSDERYRRIELTLASEREHGLSGRGLGFNRTTRRVLLGALLVLAMGAVAPFAWNYLQSYESTDDAQIDGHIDPLSSRINGTVIRVHAEDDDRVKAGELLVEIDPRDHEVAVGQARARLELAFAQVAAAKRTSRPPERRWIRLCST